MFSRKVIPILLMSLLSFDFAFSQVPPHDGDPAFANYLHQVMTNYTTWLSDKDPSSIVTQSVILKQNISGSLGEVELEFEISNQSMTGHSQTKNDIISTQSYLSSNGFYVQQSNINSGDIVQFSGHYVIKRGVLRIHLLTIEFSGEGNFTLKSNTTTEGLTYLGFRVNDQGYIDLSPAVDKAAWAYAPTWVEIHFDGLNGLSMTSQNIGIVEEAMAEVYARFLRAQGIAQTDKQYIIPRQLMMQYVDESLKQRTLEDILSNWKPTTTNPPEETTKSSGNGSTINFFLILIVFILYTFHFPVY